MYFRHELRACGRRPDRWTDLNVSGSLVRLVGDLLLHAGQLLLEVEDFVLVKFCQVVELLLQTLTPEHTNGRKTGT